MPRLLHALFALLISLFLVSAEPLAAQQATPAPDSSTAIAPLLEVLKDDTARAQLIAELERLTADTPTVEDKATAAPKPEPESVSIGRRIAVLTQGIAEAAAEDLTALWQSVGKTGDVFSGLRGNEVSVITSALRELLLVIALTIAVFLVLRRLAIPIFRRMGNRAVEVGLMRTGMLFIGGLLIDALVVIAAWAIGYAVTVIALGEFGQIGIRQTMYLNAFLLVELVKVAMRALLSPSSGGLRVLPLSDRAAQRLNRSFNVAVSILGYGQLLLVPITNQSASYAAGNAISAILALLVLVYLVVLVIRYRLPVGLWLRERLALDHVPDLEAGPVLDDDLGAPADTATIPDYTEIARPGVMATLAMHWHWFMLVYLGSMFMVVMTQPTDATFAALIGSGKIALALVVASLVSGILSGAVGRGVRLPQELTMKLPLLEPRLNRVVPRALIILRYAMVAIVVLFALDTIGAIPLRDWMNSQLGFQLTSTIISVSVILVVSYAIWLAMTSWVDYRLNPDYGNVATARETTLLTLLRNAATIALFIITMMFCLSEIGLDIGPLLASAGVLGLAIGFGSQKLVQDIITGIFIQFENAINVGNVIDVNGTTGVVEKLTIRSVSLRDLHGAFHLIPFSSVDMVSNFTRDFSYFVCDMGVAYRENIDDVKQAMLDCFDELINDPEIKASILGELEWLGLNSFGDSAVVVRARIKTQPGKQWGIGRAYNGILKRVFDERGIEIPFPHQTIFFGEAKDGSTQPIRLIDDKKPKPAKAPAEKTESTLDVLPDSDDDD